MKQKQAKALLPVAAILTHAIISSRKNSENGVTATQAVTLLDEVMQQLSASSHGGNERKAAAADRQLASPKLATEKAIPKPIKAAPKAKPSKPAKARPISTKG